MPIHRIIALIIVFLLTTSCNNTLDIYYPNLPEHILDGELWPGTLELFFSEDFNRIENEQIYSKVIYRELEMILKTFKNATPLPTFDDNYYEYAFIVSQKDTLFTNAFFKTWRYKGYSMQITSDMQNLMQDKFQGSFGF